MIENTLIKGGTGHRVSCHSCNKINPLSGWSFVQTYWYESPRGCTGGGNWWPSKDIMQCLLICPNACGVHGANFL